MGWCMKVGMVVGAVIVIAALVICVVPLKTVAYTAMVDYEDTETYYEEEPYEDVETYTTMKPFDYEVVDSFDREKNGHPCGYVEIKNTDDTSGVFSIAFSFRASYGQGGPERFCYNEEQLYLAPNQSKIAMYCEDKIGIDDNWSWGYEIYPATEKIEGERTVTKYRQVEKQRTVTRQRRETRYKRVTLLDYLLHYE